MAVCINPGFVRSELSERSVDTPYKAKWLPQVVDRDIVDDREDVSCWSELHEDDQRKTWDEWGD